MIDKSNPVNTDVIAWLRAHSNPNPPPGPAWSVIDGYELHSHPDLCEQLDSLPNDAQSVDMAFYHGFKVHSCDGVIFAIAPAIYEIALRYQGNDILADEKPFRDVGREWVLVEAFNNPFLKSYYDTAWRYATGKR